MSTRASIRFFEGDREYIKLYHHWDGYIEGLGYDIANWLLKKRVVNGIGGDTTNICNGTGCLIAQFIHDFKTEPGNLYVEPIDSGDEWCDYNYKIVLKDGELGNADDITQIIVTNWGEGDPIFAGKPSELLKFKESED